MIFPSIVLGIIGKSAPRSRLAINAVVLRRRKTATDARQAQIDRLGCLVPLSRVVPAPSDGRAVRPDVVRRIGRGANLRFSGTVPGTSPCPCTRRLVKDDARIRRRVFRHHADRIAQFVYICIRAGALAEIADDPIIPRIIRCATPVDIQFGITGSRRAAINPLAFPRPF